MKKRGLLLALVLTIALIATSCYHGMVMSDMKITSPEGKGERTFSVALLKDGAADPKAEGKTVSGMFEADENGKCCFPSGIDPVFKALQEAAPKEAGELKLEEKDDRYIISFTISFDNIDEFNQKCKAIVGEDNWEKYEMEDATLSVKETDGKKEVTYHEDISLTSASAIWGAKALIDLNDPTVFNNTEGGGVDLSDGTAIFYTHMRNVTVGETTKEFPESADDVTVTGEFKLEKPPVESEDNKEESENKPGNETSKPEESAKTGTESTMFVIVLLTSLLSAGVIIAAKKRGNCKSE